MSGDGEHSALGEDDMTVIVLSREAHGEPTETGIDRGSTQAPFHAHDAPPPLGQTLSR